MKINIIVILLFLVLPACSSSSNEPKNYEFYRGSINVDELFKKYPVFSIEPELEIKKSEFSIDENIKVLIFFGTWCHDSKRELPRVLKILQSYELSENNLELIAVGPDKKEPLGRATKLNLIYTPTIIFFRESKEIGRIIEKPVRSLEKDIESIISSN